MGKEREEEERNEKGQWCDDEGAGWREGRRAATHQQSVKVPGGSPDRAKHFDQL